MAVVSDGLGHAAVLTPEALTGSNRDITKNTEVLLGTALVPPLREHRYDNVLYVPGLMSASCDLLVLRRSAATAKMILICLK